MSAPTRSHRARMPKPGPLPATPMAPLPPARPAGALRLRPVPAAPRLPNRGSPLARPAA